MHDTPARVPAGTPVGGQFATAGGQRSPITLDDNAPQSIQTNAADPYRFDVAIRFPQRDHVSVSQLTSWQRCQLQWALQQHHVAEQAPGDPTAAKRYYSAVERRDLGIRFHAAAEAALGRETPPEPDDKTGELLEAWHRAEPGVDPTRSHPEVEIRGRMLDDHTGELVSFVGYADRVDELDDNTVRLVDYKTGAHPYLGDTDDEHRGSEPRHVRRPPSSGLTQAELQLLTYADQLGKPVSSIRVVYPATTRSRGPLVVDRDVTAANLAQARAITARLVAQISVAEAAGTVTTSDGSGCTTCGYHRHCPQQGGSTPADLQNGHR